MNFNDDEQKILNHFFTNLDKDIFGTKNIHPEVWALFQAMYSRSKSGLREGFLKMLKEDQNNYQDMLNFIKTGNMVTMEHAINKAIIFMDKWVLGYGHSSVAEGAVAGFGLEGVTILATKVIEDNTFCSFIEKSTRYVHFDKDSFYIDPVIDASEFGQEFRDVVNLLFDTYVKLHQPVLDYIKKTVPLSEGQSEKAWLRSCAARRFDAIRYLLPACTKTALGWTINARTLAHAISKMSSHPLNEMNQIAKDMKTEGVKVFPSLLKYSDRNPYIAETSQVMRREYKDFVGGLPSEGVERVNLVNVTPDATNILLSTIIYKHSLHPYNVIYDKVSQMSDQEKEELFDQKMKRLGKFDVPPRELDNVEFTFDILIDYGAFRDIQRHRQSVQINQLLTTYYGYDVPPDIINAGVKDEYDLAMNKANDLFRRMYQTMPFYAQYIVPLAYRKRVLMKFSLRGLHSFIKARTTPQGHYSYRTIAREMFDKVKASEPLLSKYIQCNLEDDELGRLKSEMRFEEKINKGEL